tara:strand:- start:3199 stop:3792 length:594 start_codon:yes stop_codon:yes gene_type:complete
MVTLQEYYDSKNIIPYEGHVKQIHQQISFIQSILKENACKNILEIGFNAGHSSELFLSFDKDIKVISFDIGEYDCVSMGKQFIDEKYPDRHELIWGDTQNTIPDFISSGNTKLYDLIFIDGGHEYNIAKNDIINCKHLAHSKTIVLMDDTLNNKNWMKHWNYGPTRAWNELKDKKFIKELGSIDYQIGRGNSWGMYS